MQTKAFFHKLLESYPILTNEMPFKITESAKDKHKDKIRTRKLSQWQADLLNRRIIDRDWKIEDKKTKTEKCPVTISKKIRNCCFICDARKVFRDKGRTKGHKLYEFSRFNFYNLELFNFLTSLGYEDEQESPNDSINRSFSENNPIESPQKPGKQWKYFIECVSYRRNSIQHQLMVCELCKSTFDMHNRNDSRPDLLSKASIRHRKPNAKANLTKTQFTEQRMTDSSFQILTNGQHLKQSDSSDDVDQNNQPILENTLNEVGNDFTESNRNDHDLPENEANHDLPENEANHDLPENEANHSTERLSRQKKKVSSQNNPNNADSEKLINTESQSENVLYTLPIIHADDDICCLCLKDTDIESGIQMNHHLIMLLGKNAIRDRIGDGISITFDTSSETDFFCQVICDECCIFDEEKKVYQPESVHLRPNIFTHLFFQSRKIVPKPIFDSNLIRTGVVSNFINEINEQYMIARKKTDELTKLALKSQQEIERLRDKLKQASLFVYDEFTLRKLCGIGASDIQEIKKFLAPFASTFSISKGGKNIRKLNLDELITAFFFFLRQKIDIYHLALIINHNKGRDQKYRIILY